MRVPGKIDFSGAIQRHAGYIVASVPPQITGPKQRAPRCIKDSQEAVAIGPRACLHRGENREIERCRGPRHVSIPFRRYRQRRGAVGIAAAQKSEVRDTSGRAQAADKRIVATRQGRLVGAAGYRQIRRRTGARHVNIAVAIQRHGIAQIRTPAAKTRQIGELPYRANLGHETVNRLQRAGGLQGSRKIHGIGLPREIGVSGRIRGDCRGDIVSAPTEITAPQRSRTGCIQFHEEGIVIASMKRRLDRARQYRKIDRRGVPAEIQFSSGVDRRAHGEIRPRSAGVSRIFQAGAAWIELQGKSLFLPAGMGLPGAAGDREIGRVREAGQVGIPAAIHRQAASRIPAGAADVGGVDHGGSRRIQFDDEGVAVSRYRTLIPRPGRQAVRTGFSRQINIPGRIHGHGIDPVIPRSAQVTGVAKDGINPQFAAGIVGPHGKPHLPAAQ